MDRLPLRPSTLVHRLRIAACCARLPLAAGLAVLCAWSTASADISTLGPLQTNLAFFVRGVDAAPDPNGGFLVVGAQNAVLGVCVNGDGAPTSAAFTIKSSSATFGAFPRARYAAGLNNGQGGFLVVWPEEQSNTIVLKSRVVTCSGPVGSEQVIDGGYSAWLESGAALAYSETSQKFLVAWKGAPPETRLKARILDLNGAPVGATLVLSTGFARDPGVTWNSNTDDFGVSFSGETSTAAFSGFVKVPAGAPSSFVRTTFNSIPGGMTTITDIAYNPTTRRYVMTWFETAGALARVAEIDEAGNVVSTGVASSTLGSYDALSLAWNDESGTFLLVGLDRSTDNLRVRELNKRGVGLSAEVVVPSTAAVRYPRVAANASQKRWHSVWSRSFTAVLAQELATTTTDGGGEGGYSGGGSTPPPPPPASNPAITSFTPNVSFPVPINKLVTFTAAASGGTGPLQYRFVTYNASVGWVVTQDYSPLSTFSYYPGLGTNAVQVWVRSANSTADYDTYASSGLFTVTAGDPTITSFTANKSFPIAAGTPVTFTAIAGGGSGLQYRFVTYNSNSGWAIAQEYSAANTFTYSPRAGTNAVQAWVKSSASSAAYDTYATSGYFTVTAAPISVTSFTAGVSFPVALNKLVTFAAQATGSGTLEYSFVTYNEKRGWTVAQAYGPLQTFGYYPGAGKNAVQVWVRRVGSTASYETWASSGYFDVVAFPPPVITSFTANVAFPTRVNTLVAFTAQASGGSGNLEYRFVTYHPNTGWVIAQDYGPLRTFGYYPAVGQNVVQVWVRNAGSTVSYEAWQTSGYFTVAP